MIKSKKKSNDDDDDDDESILVADFGESFIIDGITKTKFASGTEPYMAPERFNSLNVSKKSDLWSCGVIIFEMIHLRRPFKGREEICNDKYELNFEDANNISNELLKPLLIEYRYITYNSF